MNGPEAPSQKDRLLARRAELREDWDNQFANAAHFVIGVLLEYPQAERNTQLLSLKTSVDTWVKQKKDKTAGDYEAQDFKQDIFREIIYRIISRLPGREVLTKEALKISYEQLDSEIYANCPPVNWELIASLNSGENNEQTILYLEQIKEISDVLVKIDIANKDQRGIMEKIIHTPEQTRQTERGFQIQDARKLRIMQDIILNLITRLPHSTPKIQKDRLNSFSRIYLPRLNSTKAELYRTAVELEALSRLSI